MKKIILIIAMMFFTAAGFSQLIRTKANIAKSDTCMDGVEYTNMVYVRINHLDIDPNEGRETTVHYTIYESVRGRNTNGQGCAVSSFSYPTLGWDRATNEAVIIAKFAEKFKVLPSAVNLNQ